MMNARHFAKPAAAPAKGGAGKGGPPAAAAPPVDEKPKIDPEFYIPESAFPLGPLRNGLTK